MGEETELTTVVTRANSTSATEEKKHSGKVAAEEQVAAAVPQTSTVKRELPRPHENACTRFIVPVLVNHPYAVFCSIWLFILVTSYIGLGDFFLSIQTGLGRSAYADPNDIRK